MDKKTRGFLEKAIDEVMAGELLPQINWIQDEMLIKSLGEVAIGYTIGGIEAASTVIVQMGKKSFRRRESKG